MLIDAAAMGSRAHRLRNFWTNLADSRLLSAVVESVERDPGILVQQIMDQGRMVPLAQRNSPTNYYPCNKAGQPMAALPTFVSVPNSRAYRLGKAGAIFDSKEGHWDEPNPDERERCMGYATGTTAAPRLTRMDRHRITGRAMDANTMRSLLAITIALWKRVDNPGWISWSRRYLPATRWTKQELEPEPIRELGCGKYRC